jgi:hypothetical protein
MEEILLVPVFHLNEMYEMIKQEHCDEITKYTLVSSDHACEFFNFRKDAFRACRGPCDVLML